MKTTSTEKKNLAQHYADVLIRDFKSYCAKYSSKPEAAAQSDLEDFAGAISGDSICHLAFNRMQEQFRIQREKDSKKAAKAAAAAFQFPFDASAVTQVYSGRANTCCCGCAGTHSMEAADIKLVLGKIAKFALAGLEIVKNDEKGTCFSIDTETRTYIAYLRGK